MLRLDRPASKDDFDEEGYLHANPDITAAVRKGAFRSGLEHFDRFGFREARRIRSVRGMAEIRAMKMAKLRPLLRTDMVCKNRGGKLDFLSDELRKQTGIIDTAAVSANDYDGYVERMIEDKADGLVLDCGAGRRPVYYPNVINYEIVDYDTTDVLGVGEELPFLDNSFDGIVSVAVLEHVRDPFRCAKEIIRVLKPGGTLVCSVPFLQPYHGYPHHYFNMTPQGLRSLFENDIDIKEHTVIDSIHPIASLTWIVSSWAEALPDKARDEFLGLSLRDLCHHESFMSLVQEPWCQLLPQKKQMELASATLLVGQKHA